MRRKSGTNVQVSCSGAAENAVQRPIRDTCGRAPRTSEAGPYGQRSGRARKGEKSMLTSVGLSTPGAAPLREGNSWEALPGGSGGISALRGREKELNGVARVLRDTRASGLAVRICIEGPPGAGREAFAAECLRAARALGLRSQGPLRCPGREHRLPALA